MYCYKHAEEEEEEEEEKAAVRVKGERRGRSRFTVTFSPVLPKQKQPAVVVGGFFSVGTLCSSMAVTYIWPNFFLPLGKNIFGKMSLLPRLANFLFISLFCGNGSACGGGKTNKNGASEQGLFLPLCLRHGNTARKNKKVANVPGVYFPVHFFPGKRDA